MELTTLRYLVAIGEAGHMTRAAEGLGVSQPALSAAVRKAEAEVGAALFHRTGKGVEVTAAGEVFLRHAARAIREAEAGRAAVAELMGLEAGTLSIGGGATAVRAVLPGVVGRFLDEHPGIRVYVREAGSAAVAAAVIEGELDLGIVTLPTRVVGEGELMTVGTVRDELRLIVPRGHRLEGAASFRWADLAGEAVVGFEAGSAVRELLDDAARSAGVDLRVVMELRSIDAIERMVGAGIGVGFVSALALRGGGAACAEGAIGRELGVVRRRDRVPSAAAGVFERMLVEGIGGLG